MEIYGYILLFIVTAILIISAIDFKPKDLK